MSTGAYPFKGQVRHYAWGGHEYIPRMLGRAADGQPWAEYWLGAHPGDPGQIEVDGQWQALDRLIASNPDDWLGRATGARFGELPFLFKILDVARPLSIQVHPNRDQAIAGYARENALGIALSDPKRNFKDRQHKPELALALSDFWLLYGFRPATEIGALLEQFPSLVELTNIHDNDGLEALFSRVMTASQIQLEQWLVPLLEGLQGTTSTASAEHWMWRWRELHDTPLAAVDRGVFGFLMMNLIALKPGETVFQDANVPHAYLAGQCAEIMANSDNVLRGGLTPKHVDPEGLCQHINFVAGRPASQPPPDLEEFGLRQVTVRQGTTLDLAGSEIKLVLVLEGRLESSAAQWTGGDAALIKPGLAASMRCVADASLLVASPGPSSSV